MESSNENNIPYEENSKNQQDELKVKVYTNEMFGKMIDNLAQKIGEGKGLKKHHRTFSDIVMRTKLELIEAKHKDNQFEEILKLLTGRNEDNLITPFKKDDVAAKIRRITMKSIKSYKSFKQNTNKERFAQLVANEKNKKKYESQSYFSLSPSRLRKPVIPDKSPITQRKKFLNGVEFQLSSREEKKKRTVFNKEFFNNKLDVFDRRLQHVTGNKERFININITGRGNKFFSGW